MLMDDIASRVLEPPGAGLGHVLDVQRIFLQNVHSLMRFLHTEVTKDSALALVKNGSYCVTRNGYASGLASFNPDWVMDQAGIAFVETGRAVGASATRTEIGPSLRVLVFQVRWLAKSRVEPVVWKAALEVRPASPAVPSKWEDYQSLVFNRLDSKTQPDDRGQGLIQPGVVTKNSVGVSYAGTYLAVPVADLQREQDAIHRLVHPVLDPLPSFAP
jgi:hypothetical protein